MTYSAIIVVTPITIATITTEIAAIAETATTTEITIRTQTAINATLDTILEILIIVTNGITMMTRTNVITKTIFVLVTLTTSKIFSPYSVKYLIASLYLDSLNN